VQLRQELEEQPGHDCGADNVRYLLQQIAVLDDWGARGWRVPSRATIHKIMKRHGLVRPEPRKRPKSSYRRFAYARPRDCYQIDATEVELAGGAKVVVFEVLDDCTRVLVATLAWEVENAAGAIAAITAAFDRFGVPALVLADNGSAFTCRTRSVGISRFTRVVTAAGARLIHSSPYHPQTCGKVERHHRTFKAWLHAQPVPPATLAELQTVCDRYQAWLQHLPSTQRLEQTPTAGLGRRPHPRRAKPAPRPIRRPGQSPHRLRQWRHPTQRTNRGLGRSSPRRHPSHRAPRRRPRHHLQPQRRRSWSSPHRLDPNPTTTPPRGLTCVPQLRRHPCPTTT
jgi:hypothetical protein